MEEKLIISGFGGQGVQSLGQTIIYAGMLAGNNVSLLPSYGPEMRGGTTNCQVVISDAPIGAPIIDVATCVMALNKPSLVKFEPFVAPGGNLFINSSLIDDKATRTDINVHYVQCTELAQELGNIRVGNMIMLGAYMKLAGVLSIDSVIEALRKVLGPGKENLLDVNRRALQRGMELV